MTSSKENEAVPHPDRQHEAEMADTRGIEAWERKELDRGYGIASKQRDHTNYTLGVLLTAVEAALGDGTQAKALKHLVRREVFALNDRNQAEVYIGLGVQKSTTAPAEIHVDEPTE